MTNTELNRRNLLKVFGYAVTADLLAAQSHHVADQAFTISGYQPRHLSPAEYDCVAQLCEIIIPSDADSPGAIECGVPWYIDTVLLYADGQRQNVWHSGLKSIDAVANQLGGNTFLGCSPPDRLQVLQHLSRNEEFPETPEEKFFCELKALTVQAFCLSDLGMRDYLHYRGNIAIPEFPGCEISKSDPVRGPRNST